VHGLDAVVGDIHGYDREEQLSGSDYASREPSVGANEIELYAEAFSSMADSGKESGDCLSAEQRDDDRWYLAPTVRVKNCIFRE
jgi:hypothetical protein